MLIVPIVKVMLAIGLFFLLLVNYLGLLTLYTAPHASHWVSSLILFVGVGVVFFVTCWALRQLSPSGMTGCFVGLSLLAVIVVPNAIASRCRSRISPAVGSIESVRAAIAAYAADSRENTFPAVIADWGALTVLVNAHGANLKNTAAKQGFHLRSYTGIDVDADGIYENYTMSFLVDGIPDTNTGRLIAVSPSGIDKTKP
jgi:hypothetical protein